MCEDGRKIGLWIIEKSQTSIPMIAVNIQNINNKTIFLSVFYLNCITFS